MRLALATLALLACNSPQTSLTNSGKDDDFANGSGKMELDKTELVIADIQGTYSKSESITLTSVGDANLLIYEIRIVANPDEVFFFDEVEDVELANGQTATYSVVAHYTTEPGFPSEGQLRIRSSDPDAANVIIPLYAYPEGYEPPDDTGDTGSGGDTGDTGSGSDTGDDSGAR